MSSRSPHARLCASLPAVLSVALLGACKPVPPVAGPPPAAKSVAASSEPPLESMQPAKPPTKLSVPVDLKYSFEHAPRANQPVTLHLAAVPRVAVTNLVVSIQNNDGVLVANSNRLHVQKANAKGAFRQQFSITRQDSAPELRVLITADLPQGSGHGFFSIPLDSGMKSQKLDSVKQR